MQERFHLLIVEDNSADSDLLQIILQDSGYTGSLTVVTDGEQALQYLSRQGKYASATEPNAILLDLNLPRIGGIEVLSQMRSLGISISVYVLSTSIVESDRSKCEEFGVKGYFTKPRELETFEAVVHQLLDHHFRKDGYV